MGLLYCCPQKSSIDSQILISNTAKITNVFDLSLESNETIINFEKRNYCTKTYCVLKIDNIEDMNIFLKKNNLLINSQKYYYKLFFPYPNMRFYPSNNNMKVLYKENTLYICTKNQQIIDLFFELERNSF